MTNRLAARAVTSLTFGLDRVRRDERGQATVEYAGLAMAVGVLLLAVGSFLGGKDHGIGAIVVDAVKSAVERASGGGK
jgi:Flp pilus assembly pilin Flp